MAATCTWQSAAASTSNVNAYTSSSFTPSAADLIVLFVTMSGNATDLVITDTQTLGWTRLPTNGKALWSTSANQIAAYVSNASAAASATTITATTASGTATGAILSVYTISGMTKYGSTAIVQSVMIQNQTTGVNPNPTFGSAVNTNNPTLEVVSQAHASPTMAPPTGWTEGADTSYATPTVGTEDNFRNSGFTGTTITWTDTTGVNAWGCIAVELDSSGSTPVTATGSNLMMMGV